MDEPIITRRHNGEYSTVRFPSGVIETVWFPDNGDSKVVGRTMPANKKLVAEQHIKDWENVDHI